MMKFEASNVQSFTRGTVEVKITVELANAEEMSKFLEGVHDVYDTLGYDC